MRTRLMMMVLTLMVSITAMGQGKTTVTGTIIENGTNEIVAAATVRLLKTTPDSSMVAGVATNMRGVFTLKDVTRGKYVLKVSFIGYETKTIPVDLTSSKKTRDLGIITLSTNETLLSAATVTAQASRVQVRGDSLIYNADAYRVPEGSVLEDLVKKLPGAQVSDDGTIKINGKEVKKILVDGKEFFLNDRSVAMKNLPTNIIENIKTYDRKSDLARVTGIDDGEEETVLDLTVKKGMNNGWFGQINGGLGTEHRYSGRANVNYFNGHNQYSVIANANNVGDRGFGGGGGRGWGGGGSGLNASKELGFTFATETEKLELGGSVRHRYDGSDRWSQTSTQNFVTPTGAFSNSESQSYSSNSSYNANFRLEWKPDSMTNIIFRPNGSISRNRGSSKSKSGSYNSDPNEYDADDLEKAENEFFGTDLVPDDEEIADIVDMIVNTNLSRSQTYSNNKNLNGELQYNRKFNMKGRNLTIRVTGGLSSSESKQLSASQIKYNEASGRDNDINNRYYTTPGRNRNYSLQATYSEPIADRTYLQFSYRYNYSYNKSDRDAGIFAADQMTYIALVNALRNNRYDIPGALDQLASEGIIPDYTSEAAEKLSQFSQYRNMNHTIGISFRRTRDNYNLNMGVELLPQHSELTYEYMGKSYPKVTRNVFNFTPTLNFRYKFDNMTNLQLTYRGRTSQPSMTNLLDITDDSNPLNIRKGNPDLKPSFNSQFRAFFNTFDADKQRGIFSHAYFSMTQNQIDNRTSYDATTGVRTTKPENINGNWQAGLGAGLNMPLDRNKLFNINAFTNFGYNHNVSYLDPTQFPDDDRSTTNTITLREDLNIGFRKDWFDLSLNGNVNYNHSKNNVVTTNNLDTWQFSYGLEMNLISDWGTSFSTDIAMNSRRGYSQKSMNTNELIWNAQVSHAFLKGKALVISLMWNDILQKQSNISRTVNAMMSSDSRNNAIYSYAMLRVTYKLNIFGGRNANGTDNERNEWGMRRGDGPSGRPSGRPGGRPGGGGPAVRVTR